MGHRINFVHNMMHGRDAMPAWNDYGKLLRHGALTFLGMLYHYSPAFVFAAFYFYTGLLRSSPRRQSFVFWWQPS